MQLTRRGFLGGAVGATAASFGWSVGLPPLLIGASAHDLSTVGMARLEESLVAPRPIPNGDNNTHHFLPGRGKEVTTITDFKGFVGIGQLTGTGTATGFTGKMNFSVDNRFLIGEFVGVDGLHHHGAFGVF